MNRKITRLFSLFLTLAMALSLTACGGKKEEAPAEAPRRMPLLKLPRQKHLQKKKMLPLKSFLP